ncbi:MAG: riboflavin synthase [Pseudomonadota bacterium]
MFTGLITDVGRVRAIEHRDGHARVVIGTSYAPESIADGASIACSGPCLTAVDKGSDDDGHWFAIDASSETLARTTMGDWKAGSERTSGTLINLERSLKIGDEMGGHLVTGHVDGIAKILSRTDTADYAVFEVEVPKDLALYVAEKGSIALDGTSLTVNSVAGNRLKIMLIPHSLKVTTWGATKAGDRVNVEVDLMARYAARRSAVLEAAAR